MAGILYVFASDTGDLATATETIKLRQVGAEVEISRHLPAGGDILLEPAVEFAAKLRAALPKITADPSSGFEDDILDDPTLAVDPKRLAYREAVSGGSDAEVEIIDATKKLALIPATASDIDAALVLLGL